ncbi:MAG: hypothetical protein EAZ89_19690 [Bacteroidetes bacterium]|nr:MAG: hypothetical protein EAZ89_19690 [Bacteroidota bacterium]
MSLKSVIGLQWARHRAEHLRRIASQALALQEQTFQQLMRKATHTEFGRYYGFQSIYKIQEFQARVPVRDYEGLRPWLDRIYKGEADVCWPGKPAYLAKTSGTTSGTKYIPITRVSMSKQVLGARDTLMAYMAATGKADFLDGKMMFLSGSPAIETNEYGLLTGRLSGISNHFVPGYLLANRVPSWEANIIEDWEEKVRTIVGEVKGQDLRLISGIPPWVQMLFEELKRQTGKNPLEVWPNLQLFIQGGVDFSPYKSIFEQYFEGKVDITELFPASEGFFAFQDQREDDGLLLMPNYGIFFEFIPLEYYGDPHAPRLTLKDVEVGRQYALVLSSNAGLWAYDIGDTVKFTSVNPWRIRVSGRVKHFISAFGEHVISEEVNRAMIAAAQATGAEVNEFTVAPLIRDIKGQSAHEWLVEFAKEPDDFQHFCETLDQELRKLNTYYNDLREGAILQKALVRKIQLHASREYMKSVGKLGGQNKFPRLSNDRRVADALTAYIQS